MRESDTTRKIYGRILKESEKAILMRVIAIDSLEDEIDSPHTSWFPFSQTKTITRSNSSEADTLEVSEWILRQKGFDV